MTTSAPRPAEPAEPTSPPARRTPRRPGDRAGWRFAELVGLCGLAIAQPLLDIYSKNPLELISRQVEGWSVVAFAVIVVAVPPLVLLGIEQLVGLVAPTVWVRRTHALLLALLAGAFVVQLLPTGPLLGVVALALGTAAAVGMWFGVQRLAALRQWLRFLAVAPVMFAVLFVASGGIADLALSSPPAAATVGTGTDPPPVVVIVLDELPTSSLLAADGSIDRERFPHIAELAAGATWYPNETTLGSWTSIAVPGILTGRYPDVPDNRAHWTTYPQNLFTLLGDRYRVVAHESSTRLCPDTICPDAGRPRVQAVGDISTSAATLWARLLNPFQDVEVAFEPAGADMTKAEAHDLAVRTAADLVASDEPTLAYLHLSLPHQPWHLLPSGQASDAPEPTPGLVANRWIDDMAAASAYQRHLLQLEFTDTVVGDVLDTLRDGGRYDDALVVLAADHGASFRAGGDQRAISDQTIADVAFPPLIIKVPGQREGRVDERPTQTIDILPTIADVVGVDVPWELDGVSLESDDPLTDRPRRYYPVWIDQLDVGPDGHAVLPDQPLLELLRASGRDVGSAPALEALGTDVDLAGTRIEELVVAPEPGGTVVVHGAEDLADLDLSAPTLPLFVDLELGQDETGPLAVAVDGTVALTVRTGGPGGRHVWAVIPPDRVRDGRNDVRVYRVGEGDGEPVLVPLTTTSG